MSHSDSQLGKCCCGKYTLSEPLTVNGIRHVKFTGVIGETFCGPELHHELNQLRTENEMLCFVIEERNKQNDELEDMNTIFYSTIDNLAKKLLYTENQLYAAQKVVDAASNILLHNCPYTKRILTDALNDYNKIAQLKIEENERKMYEKLKAKFETK